MMSHTLFHETDAWSSTEPALFEETGSIIGRTTCEVAGGIVRKPALLNEVCNETQMRQRDITKTSAPGRPLVASPLIRLTAGTLPNERVRVLQQWEGVVTETTEDSFFAELQDLGKPSGPLEFVEIPFEEVPRDDQPLLVEGAVFYWSIGYETSPGGQLRRMSEIRMRRTPRWTRRTLQLAKRQAEELFEFGTEQ